MNIWFIIVFIMIFLIFQKALMSKAAKRYKLLQSQSHISSNSSPLKMNQWTAANSCVLRIFFLTYKDGKRKLGRVQLWDVTLWIAAVQQFLSLGPCSNVSLTSNTAAHWLKKGNSPHMAKVYWSLHRKKDSKLLFTIH